MSTTAAVAHKSLSASGTAFGELPDRPPPLPTLTQKMAHKSVTGAVRVAVRGLGGEGPGLRRSIEYQGLPHARGHASGMPHFHSAEERQGLTLDQIEEHRLDKTHANSM